MKILANDGISDAGKIAIEKAGFQLLEKPVVQEQLIHFINENQVNVLLVRSATQVRQDLIEACPSLKIIGRGGVGMDNIDVDYARSKGISVINTPAASSQSVAELVFAHFFGMIRFLHDANRVMPLEGDTHFSALKKSYTNAIEMKGKTLGIIGMGRIGSELAKIGYALGMKVIANNIKEMKSTIKIDFIDGQTLKFEVPNLSLEEVLKQSDFISVHTPKLKNYLLDVKEFQQMKKGVYIANAARGGIINELALLEYLDNNHIAGAALDVFENEPKPELQLLMHPKLSLSPHVGGNTLEAQERIGEELIQQIIQLQQNAVI